MKNTIETAGPERNRKVTLTGNKVFVRRCMQDDFRNPDGTVAFYLPEKARDTTMTFEVLAIGPDVLDVKPGDIVSTEKVPSDSRCWRDPFGDVNEIIIEEQNIICVYQENDDGPSNQA